MSAKSMSDEQKNQVIEFLMYHLDMDTRQTLMASLPVAYNAYHEQAIVKVVSVKDERVFLPLVTELVDGKFIRERKAF